MSRAEIVRCWHCARKLTGKRITMLELNNYQNTWHREGDPQPEHESQGCFAFGPDCAKAVVAGTEPVLFGDPMLSPREVRAVIKRIKDGGEA